MRVRGVIWLAGSLAAVLLVVAAALWLRRMAQEPPQAPPPVAAVSPAAPAAAKPAPEAPPPPSFDVVSVDRHGQAVIAGRAEPGDRVRVLDGDRPLGEVTADARGEWVLVPAKPIAPGRRSPSDHAGRR